MTNLLEGHEDFIVSHTRKEIMQKFNVNYNYVNNFCNRNGIRPIAERDRYFVTDEMKNYLKEHTIKDTAYKFHVGYNWLSIKVREMNIPCKRHRSEVKLSVHSCKRTGEAHDMIRFLSKSFTKASIARVFGYSAERIRQICADKEKVSYLEDNLRVARKELTKAKEIIKDYMTIAKGSHSTVCGVPEENRTIYVLKLNEEAEQFLNSKVEE